MIAESELVEQITELVNQKPQLRCNQSTMAKEIDRNVRHIMASLEAIYDQPNIVAGEYVYFPDEELYRRVAEVHGVQWGVASVQFDNGGGSYFLAHGTGSYSGSFAGPAKVELEPTDEKRAGLAWIFHNDQVGQDRGIAFRVPFRVWRAKS